MKTFLIAALSLDGYIAQNPTQSSLQWTSQADKKRFVEFTKRAGVIIMGSTTFKTIGRPLKDRRMIVYTSQKIDIEGVETTSLPPQELLQQLEADGFKEVAICGGAQIYTLFAEAGLIDTMYITVEPIMLGSGIRLFNKDLQIKLELQESLTVENTLLLTYNVAK